MVGIRHCERNAALHRSAERIPETHLVIPRKDILVISDEPVDIVPHGIWRIGKNEVAPRVTRR